MLRIGGSRALTWVSRNGAREDPARVPIGRESRATALVRTDRTCGPHPQLRDRAGHADDFLLFCGQSAEYLRSIPLYEEYDVRLEGKTIMKFNRLVASWRFGARRVPVPAGAPEASSGTRRPAKGR
jgi:hypothetical protein